MSKKDAKAFINQLKTSSKLRNRLAKLDEGDWRGVAKVGESAGFRFTVGEIKTTVPLKFHKGHGKDPDAGWGTKTRR